MRRRVWLPVILIVALVAFFSGCAKVPQPEIDAAKASLSAAKTAEADRYVPEEYSGANQALNAATTEVEKQNSKFVLFRSYKEAVKMLADAKMKAEEAASAAAAKKEEVKKETEAVMAEITASIESTKGLIATAPKGKEGKQALEAIQTDLTAVEASLQEANTVYQGGDYLTAVDKAKSVLEKAKALNDEMTQAIEKYKSLKKKK
ncbi:MAG: DUF4398 domain-containing protein [Deltaproteobacteria bacterium]|nr:DUF4398 domain-containing protein [Deltaproteobacteria bacterium]